MKPEQTISQLEKALEGSRILKEIYERAEAISGTEFEKLRAKRKAAKEEQAGAGTAKVNSKVYNQSERAGFSVGR